MAKLFSSAFHLSRGAKYYYTSSTILLYYLEAEERVIVSNSRLTFHFGFRNFSTQEVVSLKFLTDKMRRLQMFTLKVIFNSGGRVESHRLDFSPNQTRATNKKCDFDKRSLRLIN